jgi:hypothetical protein
VKTPHQFRKSEAFQEMNALTTRKTVKWMKTNFELETTGTTGRRTN